MTTPTDTPRPTGGRINIVCGNFITGARWDAPDQQQAAIQYTLIKLGVHLTLDDTKDTHTAHIYLAYDEDEQDDTRRASNAQSLQINEEEYETADATEERHELRARVRALDAFHERITTRLQLIDKRLDTTDRRLENAERHLATEFTTRRAHLNYLERLDARVTAAERALLQLNTTLSVLPKLTTQLQEMDERMHDHIRASHTRG